MRHIPDDELHAYLDQALSRSQCVEIESHLARCAACRLSRDGIASLRDRTTGLLAVLAPVRSRIPPAAEVLRERARAAGASRTARWQRVAVAAALAGVAALGYAALNEVPDPAAPAPALRVAAGEPAPLPPAPEPARGTVALATADDAPVRREATPPVAPPDSSAAEPAGPAAGAPLEPIGTMLSSVQLPQYELQRTGSGLFRTLSWDGAQRERPRAVPRIVGLPVMEVQVAAARADSGKPLMIVAQQLSSGEMIRTIEGPATDVSRLLASSRPDSGSPWPTILDSAGISGGEGAMAMRRGDRILAIQAELPADSLRAMIRRLNVEQR